MTNLEMAQFWKEAGMEQELKVGDWVMLSTVV